jgi:hypothetical protein
MTILPNRETKDELPGQSEFDRFQALVKKVVSVKKEDFDAELERQKEEPPPAKPGRKKKAV